MKGYVATPEWVVDLMVAKLFADGPPAPEARILDPGSGRGAFIDGITRWCVARGLDLPRITAVESDPRHAAYLRARYAGVSAVEIQQRDFLTSVVGQYDYIIGNPPYVGLLGLSEAERAEYRKSFCTAQGRFDLSSLFFEQSLRVLCPSGRMVFITPEKFLYVQSAAPLRSLLSEMRVEELHFLSESTFQKLVTYPIVTTLSRVDGRQATRVITREGETTLATLRGRESWLPSVQGFVAQCSGPTLSDVAMRISCGVATGADGVFVVPATDLDPHLRSFAYPTVAGRDLSGGEISLRKNVMLLPYTHGGNLIPESEMGALGQYLGQPHRRRKLLSRTCVRKKPWYAFHETPPLADLLRPKLLCKDICAEPSFVADCTGVVIPRHSVYYVVPREPGQIHSLADYLNSPAAAEWLHAHCQRAANGFLRLQSHTLKRLPLPAALAIELGASPLMFTRWAA